MGNELDGKIRLDVKKLISAYPPYTKLPEVMKTHFDRLNAPIKKENEKIEAENKARAARVEPPLKKKGLNTSCVFQVSWALNAVGGGHEIPAMSPRPRSNALLSGKFHMGAVDELENYFLGRYRKPEIVKTSNRHSIGEMKKYMAGRPGIIAFRDKGLGMHTEIWNGSRILQNGAPIPNNTNGAAVMSETGIFGADRVLFWEILSENQVNLSAPWLFGWWTVSDIPSPYYYYFYPNGTVVYTRTEPRTNICPVARPEFTGSWNLTAPVGVRIKWSIEKYPVEILYYPPVASITMMAGVYESKAIHLSRRRRRFSIDKLRMSRQGMLKAYRRHMPVTPQAHVPGYSLRGSYAGAYTRRLLPFLVTCSAGSVIKIAARAAMTPHGTECNMANRKPRRPKILPQRPMLAGNLDHTDTIWGGIRKPEATEPAVSVEVVLAQHGFEYESPLEQLLLRLIDAQQPSVEERGERLRRAVAAITGKRLKKRIDLRERKILVAIAREYHREYFETRHEPELKPLIRDIIRRPAWQGFRAGTEKSVITDLARKFTASLDIILVRATTGPEWDPLDRSNQLQRVARDLSALTVPIDTGPSRPLANDI